MLTTANEAIAGLSAEHRVEVLKSVRRVHFRRGERIHVAGEALKLVYFVEKGVAALTYGSLQNGCDVANIGPGGVVSASAGLGTARMCLTSFARTDLMTTAMEIGSFEACMASRADFRKKVLVEINQLLEQMEETAYANARLTVEQRLARWLLMLSERLNSHRLPLTHAELAEAIGCNRPALTIALNRLKDRKILGQTRRNRLEIAEPDQLRQIAEPVSFEMNGRGSSFAA